MKTEYEPDNYFLKITFQECSRMGTQTSKKIDSILKSKPKCFHIHVPVRKRACCTRSRIPPVSPATLTTYTVLLASAPWSVLYISTPPPLHEGVVCHSLSLAAPNFSTGFIVVNGRSANKYPISQTFRVLPQTDFRELPRDPLRSSKWK